MFNGGHQYNLSVAVDGISFPIEGSGTISIVFNGISYVMHDVLYSPKLHGNLFSGSNLDEKGGSFKGGNGELNAYDSDGCFMFRAKLDKGFYVFYPRILKPNPCISQNSVNLNTKPITLSSYPIDIWHSHFAHIGKNLIISTSRNKAVSGLPDLKPSNTFCEPCQLGKQKRVSFGSLNYIQTAKPLERIYLDVRGLISIKGKRGEKYFLSIIDDHSRKIAIYPMTHKSQVFSIFTKHTARAELERN